jgi:hypothetical protein
MKARSLGTALITGAFVGIFLALAFTTATADLKAARLDNGVREREPVSTELSPNASAMTYWVGESDGWHVVTTVDTVIARDSEAETHAVVRFSSVLLPGQSQQISVPVAIGEPQKILRIQRSGNQIEVAQVTAPHAGNALARPPAPRYRIVSTGSH